VVAALGWYSLDAAATQGSHAGEAVLMPVIAASLTGFGLLLAAIDLWYRKHVGWLMAMVLLYALAFVQLLSGWNLEAGAVFLIATVVMFPAGAFFYRRWRELPQRAVLQRLAFAGAVPLGYGFAGLVVMEPSGFGHRLGLWEAATATARIATFGGTGVPIPLTAQANVLVLSIGALSAAAVLYAGWIAAPWLCRELGLPEITASGGHRNEFIELAGGRETPVQERIATTGGSESRRIVA
jgi:hypothetical protein